jgi:hypothetical protein
MLIKKSIWWGYVDYNEKIHIKRYKDDRAIRNAQDSGTTLGIFDPFEAANIEEAAHMILNKYREVKYFEKKEIN